MHSNAVHKCHNLYTPFSLKIQSAGFAQKPKIEMHCGEFAVFVSRFGTDSQSQLVAGACLGHVPAAFICFHPLPPTSRLLPLVNANGARAHFGNLHWSILSSKLIWCPARSVRSFVFADRDSERRPVAAARAPGHDYVGHCCQQASPNQNPTQTHSQSPSCVFYSVLVQCLCPHCAASFQLNRDPTSECEWVLEWG